MLERADQSSKDFPRVDGRTWITDKKLYQSESCTRLKLGTYRFEPKKAPSVGLRFGLLDEPFGLLKLVMFDNSMKIRAKRNFRTTMVGSGQVLLDSDNTVELVG
ncbi:hypothetical protein Bca52824_082136 [Brassica carinata]|uniref:Uncharacterized protein n=1 Tax=Brassica carinata TaxID=52824 RepID=A0A8X7TRN0_BRACI|nr:hypothetical protein Bca52824_082136 [Brassica carinata]